MQKNPRESQHQSSETEKEFKPNILTHQEETLLVMAEIEGEAWLNMQRRELENPDKYKEDQNSIVFGLQHLKKLGPLADDVDEEDRHHLVFSLYGASGLNRWGFEQDGTVRFSKHQCQYEKKDEILKKVQELGFDFY